MGFSVANKRFSVGWSEDLKCILRSMSWLSWLSMSWGSEVHFEAPVGPGKLHIFTSKKQWKWWKSVLIYFISRLYKVLLWEIIVINWIDIMNIIFKKRIIRRYYPNIHLHISYVQSFQEICIYFDRPRHPNGRQWLMTSRYLQRWDCSNLGGVLLTASISLNIDEAVWQSNIIVNIHPCTLTSNFKHCLWGQYSVMNK